MSNTVPEDEHLQALFLFLLPLTNRGTDGDGGEYAPSLLAISYLGSLGPKALRELRFFKRFFI